MPAPGTFHWNELTTTDLEGAKAFYEKAIGWEFESMTMADGGTYYIAKVDGAPAAGLMEHTDNMPEGTPSHWRSYISVKDVDATLATAVMAGGTQIYEAFDVPGVGRIGGFFDPQGGAINVITPATFH